MMGGPRLLVHGGYITDATGSFNSATKNSKQAHRRVETHIFF